MSIVFPRASAYPRVLRALAIGVACFVASALAIRFTRFDGGAACLWLATAILIAELAGRRKRDWPLPIACATLAGILATGLYGVGPVAAPLIAPSTIGEPIIAVLLLRRWAPMPPQLGTLPGVGVFLAVVGGLAPAVSGVGGAATIAWLTGTGFASNWTHWFLGHALGNVALTPIALLVLSGEMFEGIAALRWARKLEGVLLIALTVAVTLLVFGQSAYPLLFLPMLPLTVAAFRFDRMGGALAILIVTAVGGALTIAGNGPIHLIAGGANERALFLQFYLAMAVGMTLLISAELNQRKMLVVALRESEARYRVIADGSSDVILNLTADGLIEYVSPSIREMGGYDADALRGSNAATLVLPADRASVNRAHRDAIANPDATFIVEYRGVTRDGALLWCESHIRGIADEDGRVVGAVSAIRDISAHKRIEAALSQAAQTDPLTGLSNRRAFDTTLDQRLSDVSAGRGIGVCAVFDLDLFKRVNDRYGHDAGDRVLCVFADVARAAIRESDMVARLGGEEFALILWGAGMAEAHDVCDRLRREVADLSIALGAEEVRFTFSGGLVPIEAGRSRRQVLRDADDALYRAKRAGRNRLEVAA